MKTLKFNTFSISIILLCSLLNASVSHSAGGDSSGGGTILSAHPTTPEAIVKYVDHFKFELLLFFNFDEIKSFSYDENEPEKVGLEFMIDFLMRFGNDVNKAERKFWNPHHLSQRLRSRLLNGDRTIGTVLRETEIEFQMSGPCYDANHAEVDGSIFASHKNAICISPWRIAPKITDEEVRIKISSLIAHELSHLLGTSEIEATQFQEYVAFNFKNYSSYVAYKFVQSNFHYINDIIDKLDQLAGNFQKLSYFHLSEKLKELTTLTAKAFLKYSNGYYSILGAAEVEYILMKHKRVSYMSDFVEWHLSKDENSIDNKNKYRRLFKGRAEVSYQEQLSGPIDDPDFRSRFGHLKFKKISGKKDILRELDELIEFFTDQQKYFNALIELKSPAEPYFPKMKMNK